MRPMAISENSLGRCLALFEYQWKLGNGLDGSTWRRSPWSPHPRPNDGLPCQEWFLDLGAARIGPERTPSAIDRRNDTLARPPHLDLPGEQTAPLPTAVP